MRKLTTLSIAAFALAVPSLAFAQDPAEPESPPSDPAVQEALDNAKKDESGASSDDGGSESGSRLPVPYAKRPLTLTAMTLAPAFDFSVVNVDLGLASATGFGIDLGAQFGITDDIQVEATPLSIRFGDAASGYGIGRIGGTYRFLKGDFEMGANLNVNFGDGFWGIGAGVPMRLHAGDKFRLDTGANVFIYDGGADVAVGLAQVATSPIVPGPGIPLKAAFNIIDEFWAGASTGFGVWDFGNFGDTIVVPLGVDLGATIPYSDGKGPMVDLGASFGFPAFVNSFGGDAINADVWQLNVGAKGYFFL